MIRRRPLLFLLVGLGFMVFSVFACTIVNHYISHSSGPINWDERAMFEIDEWNPSTGLICGGAFGAGLLVALVSTVILAFRGVRGFVKKRV
jgi:hypothetical protein